MPSDISSEEYETQKRNGPGYCVCLYILHLSVFLQYKLKAIRTHNNKKNWKKNKKSKATPVSPRRPSQVVNTLLCNWYTLRYRVALWCYEGTYRRAIYTYRCLLWNTQQNRNFQPKEPVQRAQVARVTVLQDLETCFFFFYFSFFFVFSLPFPPVFLSVSISSDSECCSRARLCPPDCPSKYLSLALLKTINPKRWPFRREPSEQQKPIDCCLALEPSWIFDTKCSLFMDSKVNKSSLYELATWNKFDHYPR